MSKDIHLKFLTDEVVSEEQLKAAHAVIQRYGAQQGDQYDCFPVRCNDGSGFAMYSESLFGAPGPFYALLTPLGHLISRRLCDFTYDFALATGVVIEPDVLPPLVLFVDPSIREILPRRYANYRAVRVSSGMAVRNALSAKSEWLVD